MAVQKMACRIIKKHSLEVPFDLDSLVREYAEVVYKPIPIDRVDGASVNLKRPGKTPKVVVNTKAPRTRQKFTLAHELGHIIIPWHCGTIVDEVGENEGGNNSHYWQLEREANQFASELLMPFNWVFSVYKQNPDRDYVVAQICTHCGVSEEAASIRFGGIVREMEHLLVPAELIWQLCDELKDFALVQDKLIKITKLPTERVAELMARHLFGRVAYCIERDGIVIACGGSAAAYSFFQDKGAKFESAPYTYFQSHTVCRSNDINAHWWELDVKFDIADDSRSWKEILDKIAGDTLLPEARDRFKRSVNGRISGMHGAWNQRGSLAGVDKFIEYTIQRFNHPDSKMFALHPDFLVFIKNRCEALFNK